MDDRAYVGVSDHYGWAALITATRQGVLIDRRRIDLVEQGLTKHPYHHEAQALPIAEAVALVERVRVSAERRAKASLEELASEVPVPIVGVALRRLQALPSSVEECIRSYRAQCVADSVMYRRALAGAAEERGWAVHWYAPKQVFAAAEAVLGASLDAHFDRVKRSIGAPWGQDQKLAMAAAIAATRAGERA